MILTLKIIFPKDRMKLGRASLVRDDGTVILADMPVLGISDNAAAIAHNNPTHDPLKPFGNTPTGLSKLVKLSPRADVDAYGPNPVYSMDPVSGDILKAESAPYFRSGLWHHGGALNPAYTQWKGLRPTYGCVRHLNSNLALINGYADMATEFLCEITEEG